jgi:DNA invertase Pin-like site-specific DNA recombinase
MPKAIGYTRFWSGRDRDDVEAQRQAVESYCREHLAGVEFAGVSVEAAADRRRQPENRPVWFRLSLAADQGDHLVVARFNDAFRSLKDWRVSSQALSARGVCVHVVDLRLNPLLAMGQGIAWVCSKVEEAERARASERGVEMLRDRRAEGKLLNGSAGPGWRLVGRAGSRRKVPDLAERKVIRLIVGWRLASYTWESIWMCLIRRGVKTRAGMEWSVSRIKRAFAAAYYDRELREQLEVEGTVPAAPTTGVGSAPDLS